MFKDPDSYTSRIYAQLFPQSWEQWKLYTVGEKGVGKLSVN
jgi:hypothetical protein